MYIQLEYLGDELHVAHGPRGVLKINSILGQHTEFATRSSGSQRGGGGRRWAGPQCGKVMCHVLV